MVRTQEASQYQPLFSPAYGSTELTIRDIVPVRGKELEVAQLDDIKEFILVPLWAAEWREATQEDVEDHASSPHVHFQAITCTNRGRDTAKLRPAAVNCDRINDEDL